MEQNRESRNTGKRFSFLNKWCYDSWISILKNKIGSLPPTTVKNSATNGPLSSMWNANLTLKLKRF